MLIYLTNEKKKYIKNTVNEVLTRKFCEFRKLLSLIGTLVAAFPAVKAGWIYNKELERINWLQGPIK